MKLETEWLNTLGEMVQAHFADANSADVDEAVRFFTERMTADHEGMTKVVQSYAVLNEHLENISCETKAVNKAKLENAKAQTKLAECEKDLQKASHEGGAKKNEAERRKDVAVKHLSRMQENYRVAQNNFEQTKKPHLKEGLHIMLTEMKAYHEAKAASLAQTLEKVGSIDTSKFDVNDADGGVATNTRSTAGGAEGPITKI
eukprot:TRINITY_DN4377_c0_g1_i5.p1 TRINITY_DN4377_c0_g1~~TRINITY_DN4377_c0_g1_i5.p1  ORF type:complete len:202 (-),score=62.35 TRINITY_DN4377_c0_g1_i5:99-704(-)